MDTKLCAINVRKNYDSDTKMKDAIFQRMKRFDTIIVLKKRNCRVCGSDRKLQEHSCIVNMKHRFTTTLAQQFDIGICFLASFEAINTCHRQQKIKIDHIADGIFGYRTDDNLDSTCSDNYSIYFKSIVKIKSDKKNLREINDDFKKENLLIRAIVVVEEEEEEENEGEKEEMEEGEEEEEEEGEEEEEEEVEEEEDYEDEEQEEEEEEEEAEDEEINFYSVKNDVAIRLIIDLVDLYLNSKIPNRMYCKNEAWRSWTNKIDEIEYLHWFDSHRNSCSADQSGPRGKVDVDALGEMLKRFELNYTNTTLFCKGLFEWWNKQNTFFKGPNVGSAS
ncbi:hypothetical protein V1477_019377 [Vespula maculifrons]|uniref:Uncharacterized protein n=1 Tax=Vespula maculifrons TaxID=7453 RepID=A0ABD2ASE3_VESMC